MRKTVLFVCTSFYPKNAPGAHRVAKMAQHLYDFGWTPVVLCPDWRGVCGATGIDSALLDKDPCEVLRVPFMADVRHLPGRIWLTQTMRWFPHLAPFRLKREMERRGEVFLGRTPVDVIVATSPNMVSLVVARRLCEQFSIPFVPELRDIPDELTDHPGWLERRQVRIQTSILNRANVLVTNSPGLAQRLQSRHSVPIHVVYNGFDPDDYAALEPPESSRTFDIVYCGILPQGRKPGLLLDALDRVHSDDEMVLEHVRVRFYGISKRQFAALTSGRRCAHIVRDMGRIPHADCIAIQRRATILLLLSHAEGAGPMPSKVFEYLGAGRPILSIPGDVRVTDVVLRETGAGVVASTPDEIARVLCGWLAEWKKTGQVRYEGRSEAIAEYTRRKQAARFAEVLNGIAADRIVSTCRKPIEVKT